jgi:hypothetical protein
MIAVNWKVKTRKQIVDKADLFEVSHQFAIGRRVDYLREEIDRLKVKMRGWSSTLAVCVGDVNRAFIKLQIQRNRELSIKFEKEIDRLLTPTVTAHGVTEEMIEEAKEYPVEMVIEFTRGRCRAFCHESDSFSMSHFRKANRAHCFVCGKSFNPIDVLMVRDGLSFVEAVKNLSSSSAA